jgi:23S rRNA pseudouridine2605 synthase
MQTQMRLQKALSWAGVASRRASEQLIREGRVQVNGQVVTELGARVDPERDVIAVDGSEVQIAQARRYLKLHKPAGYLSVMRDDRGRRSLGDLIPDAQGLHPVGRLDLDSEGLLLLTDDGALTLRLTHPRYEHPKEYEVLVVGVPDERALDALRKGIQLRDGWTAPAGVERLQVPRWGRGPHGQSWLRIVIHEGRKRQVRRMCEWVGHPVQRLIRVRVGPIELGNLEPGAYQPLTRAELERLRAEVGWRPPFEPE